MGTTTKSVRRSRGRWDWSPVALQAIRNNATTQTEYLRQAIEHICSTDLSREAKLQILAEAECTITRVKQATSQGRQKLAKAKAEE